MAASIQIVQTLPGDDGRRVEEMLVLGITTSRKQKADFFPKKEKREPLPAHNR